MTRELEIIKLSHCFPDSPRRQKEEAIENLIDKFPVKVMCRVLSGGALATPLVKDKHTPRSHFCIFSIFFIIYLVDLFPTIR